MPISDAAIKCNRSPAQIWYCLHTGNLNKEVVHNRSNGTLVVDDAKFKAFVKICQERDKKKSVNGVPARRTNLV